MTLRMLKDNCQCKSAVLYVFCKHRISNLTACKIMSSFVVQHCPTNIMSISIDVGRGRTVSVEARLDESVATLKHRAQTALAVGKGPTP